MLTITRIIENKKFGQKPVTVLKLKKKSQSLFQPLLPTIKIVTIPNNDIDKVVTAKIVDNFIVVYLTSSIDSWLG